MSVRSWFWLISVIVSATIGLLSLMWQPIVIAYLFVVPLVGIGIYDQFQTKHAVLRNFPVIGHGRYMLEAIRPEINQYFIESDTDGEPFDRQQRSVVYQRAKGVNDTTPFGTQLDVYLPGYEWLEHSLRAKHPSDEHPRVTIGGRNGCTPYSASVLNISAMSYGSLSRNAIEALNRGAKLGGFAHNTGEGGISPYHLAGGGDLVWQIGTGYFGCRSSTGGFAAEPFTERATLAQVKMIEVKLSQGAKPGHGGILPAAKLTREIAEIRGVPLGKDVLSPPCHSAFDSPTTLLRFIAQLRELSGGKPIGFKLCVGRRSEFLSICKAMIETGIQPDFITVDGAEGGTGAAPLEFTDRMGMPMVEGLVFVHNALVGTNLREHIRIICSGKILSAFEIARAMAIGADLCNSARAMMFAIGCIQARRCNHNDCPTGVATQNPDLIKGLDVEDKSQRVARFHHSTIHAFTELLGASGFTEPSQLRPEHIHRRLDFRTSRTYAQLFDYLEPGELLDDARSSEWGAMWAAAQADQF
jgi:glutamate synthase domain-containing protein 2